MKKLAWLLALFIACAHAQSATNTTFSWDAVTAATGYKGYCAATSGAQSKSSTPIFNVGAVGTASVTLSPGTYFCAATAYNATPNSESGFSNEVKVVIPNPPLNAPANFKVTITVGFNQDTGKLEMIVGAVTE